MLVFAAPVQASSLNLMDKVTELETTEDSAEDTIFSRLRGNNLNFGKAKIVKLGSNEICIYGLTQCHRFCDELWLDLYLEQKEDGVYSTYDYWHYDTDDTSLSVSMNVIVPKNHYYRVRGYHAAKDGSKEAVTTLTSGIWVG